MIVYKDKSFVTNSEHPNNDWNGDADYVVEDDSELFKKILELYPKYNFVLDDDNNLIDIAKDETYSEEEIRQIIEVKKQELSSACGQAIVAGIDIGDEHYSSAITDQTNVIALMDMAKQGISVPYHSDGNPCRIYSPKEFMELAQAVILNKTHHTTYCNLLMRQVEDMSDIEEIMAVKYGVTELNSEYNDIYKSIMNSMAGVANEDND